MKRSLFLFLLLVSCIPVFLGGCGIYSLSGANITGKTINIRTLENRALNVVPTLSQTLTDKLRNRILSQTGLAAVNTEDADYDMIVTIIIYNQNISVMQSTTTSSQNRLTITIEVDFKNRVDEKGSFRQSFTRFADFPANQQLIAVEAGLIESIGNEIADDIFNKAFVNW